MPEITRFYGIVIKMFFKLKEYEPPHIHAIYNDHVGIFSIDTFEMIEGDMPNRARQMIVEWMKIHKTELSTMWNSQKIIKLSPLVD